MSFIPIYKYMTTKKTKIKKFIKNIGRPSAYKPEYCEKLIHFFSRQPYTERLINKYTKAGRVIEQYEKIPCEFPYFADFAFELGYTEKVLRDWRDRHEDFNSAYTYAKRLQKKLLNTLVATGIYDKSYGQFMAINITDMKAVHHVEQNISQGQAKFYLPATDTDQPASEQASQPASQDLKSEQETKSSAKVGGGTSRSESHSPPKPRSAVATKRSHRRPKQPKLRVRKGLENE